MPGHRLAALLCSKLCHDLVGPVGALLNGAELLADESSPEMRGQAIELMAQSAAEASARLAFFRMAFGAGGGLGESTPLARARQAALGMFAKGRVRLAWPETPAGAAMGKSDTRLLLNLVLLAASVLPRGGEVRVESGPMASALTTGEPASGRQWAVSARGLNAQLSLASKAALLGDLGEDVLTAETAVAQLCFHLAAAGQRRIVLREEPGGVFFEMPAGPTGQRL
jgi:histidine phosphotransferase ChpT